MARKKKASVHLPRIGHSTPNFNWYGTERLIRKYLTSSGIPTFIYYFPHSQTSTSHTIASSTPHTSSTPTTSTPSHHSFPRGCSALPDIFTGLLFYLHKLDPQLTSTLTRYIIAYDGNISDNITMETTHILCEVEDSSVELQDETSSAVVLSWRWIDACLENRNLVPTDDFIL